MDHLCWTFYLNDWDAFFGWVWVSISGDVRWHLQALYPFCVDSNHENYSKKFSQQLHWISYGDVYLIYSYDRDGRNRFHMFIGLLCTTSVQCCSYLLPNHWVSVRCIGHEMRKQKIEEIRKKRLLLYDFNYESEPIKACQHSLKYMHKTTRYKITSFLSFFIYFVYKN